jgi:hypothetical protein
MGQLFGQKDPAPIEHERVEGIIDLSEKTNEKVDEDMNPF